MEINILTNRLIADKEVLLPCLSTSSKIAKNEVALNIRLDFFSNMVKHISYIMDSKKGSFNLF